MKPRSGSTILKIWASQSLLSDSAAKWNPVGLVSNWRYVVFELSKKSGFEKDEKMMIMIMVILTSYHLLNVAQILLIRLNFPFSLFIIKAQEFKSFMQNPSQVCHLL